MNSISRASNKFKNLNTSTITDRLGSAEKPQSRESRSLPPLKQMSSAESGRKYAKISMRKPVEEGNRSPRTSLSTVDKQSVSLNQAVHIYNLKISSKLKNPTAAGGEDTPKQVSQSLDIKASKKSSVTPSMAAIKKSMDDSSTARKQAGGL